MYEHASAEIGQGNGARHLRLAAQASEHVGPDIVASAGWAPGAHHGLHVDAWQGHVLVFGMARRAGRRTLEFAIFRGCAMLCWASARESTPEGHQYSILQAKSKNLEVPHERLSFRGPCGVRAPRPHQVMLSLLGPLLTG